MNVALLRAINVGTARKVPMADLRVLFLGLGATEVRTYIQSGNVIYNGDIPGPKLEAALRERFGFAIPVVQRTGAELDALQNPWPEEDPSIVGVVYLARAPTPERLAKLDLGRIAPDELRAFGKDLWIRCPTTFAKTKITVDWLDRSLGVPSTVRNARTAKILADMANGRA